LVPALTELLGSETTAVPEVLLEAQMLLAAVVAVRVVRVQVELQPMQVTVVWEKPVLYLELLCFMQQAVAVELTVLQALDTHHRLRQVIPVMAGPQLVAMVVLKQQQTQTINTETAATDQDQQLTRMEGLVLQIQVLVAAAQVTGYLVVPAEAVL
jgi:hypothetical protein